MRERIGASGKEGSICSMDGAVLGGSYGGGCTSILGRGGALVGVQLLYDLALDGFWLVVFVSVGGTSGGVWVFDRLSAFRMQ